MGFAQLAAELLKVRLGVFERARERLVVVGRNEPLVGGVWYWPSLDVSVVEL